MSKRTLFGILLALLLASIFTVAFNIQSIDVNARLQEPAQVESGERASSISLYDTVPLQQSNVATERMPIEPYVASMEPAVRDGSFMDLDTSPPANYDEQLGLTFTQSFTSIAYNVTAVQQADSYGYGPGYLLNGVTNKGYWYQVGLSFDWPYTTGGYDAGFHFNYEVFNNVGKSVFPASGGGLESFSGSVNDGDNVLLNLHFSSGDVVMYAYDWSTGASATVTYTAVGASNFQGQTAGPANANGFFTGLMTEWWHANAYYGGEAQVVYDDTTFALSSGWFWADEWVPSNGSVLFSNYQYTTFSIPTQLQYFSTNGASEAASGYLFITGALPSTTVFLTPYRINGVAGQTITVYLNITDVTGLLTYQVGLVWSNTTVVECTSVTNGSILNKIPESDSVVVPGTINNTLGKITSPYAWSGLGSQNNMNGSGTLAVFTFKMLQTGYADVHVNNVILYYKDGVTIIPFNTVDYFTAVRGGKQYVVRVEGNPVEESSNYGGFGAESVTELSPPELINGITYLGNMTLDVNGTADGVGPFAYFNATIPNSLMNCTNEDNWVVDLDGVSQSGVLVSPGSQNTTISLTFSYPDSSSGKLTQTVEVLSNYVATSALSVTISPVSATLNVGQSQTFTSTVSGGTSPYSYQWYLNGVAQGTSSSWTFIPEAAGSYSVYLNVTDYLGVKAESNVASVNVKAVATYLIVRGEDDAIYYRLYNSTSMSWENWNVVPNGATVDSPAAAVYSGTLYIVVRGEDDQSLWFGSVNLTDNAFSGWTMLSGATPSAPTLVSYGAQLCLVVRGMDDSIYYRFYNCTAESWGQWSRIPTGATIDRPAATVMGQSLYLVVRGMDGSSMWQGSLNISTSQFSGWTLVTGATPSAPALASYQAGAELDLMVRGEDNGIYLGFWNSSGWQGWTRLPSGATPNSPSLTVVGSTLQLTVQGMDGSSLWFATVDLTTGAFSGWTLLNGPTPSAPTLTS